MNPKNKALSKKMGEGKDSYLNRERRVNASFMRKNGLQDVLSSRKSIGRHGKK